MNERIKLQKNLNYSTNIENVNFLNESSDIEI